MEQKDIWTLINFEIFEQSVYYLIFQAQFIKMIAWRNIICSSADSFVFIFVPKYDQCLIELVTMLSDEHKNISNDNFSIKKISICINDNNTIYDPISCSYETLQLF